MLKSKKQLKKEADNHTTVVKRKGRDIDTLKQSIEQQPRQCLPSSGKVAGLSKGVTISMGDFQSLRIDCWLTDYVDSEEEHTEVLNKLSNIIDERIEYEVEAWTEEFNNR